MRQPFARTRDGSIRARLPAEGVALLKSLAKDFDRRLEAASDPAEDANFQRLFPRAYEDDAQEEKFVDSTRGFLVASKRGAVAVLSEVLDRGETKRGSFEVSMTDDEVNALVGVLNDLRLVLGTSLDVTEEDQPTRFVPADEDNALQVNSYLWLGGVQEAILEVLLGERGTSGTD